MTPEAQKTYALIRQVRTCFNRLKGMADEMNRDLGVNASMRAVVESLSDNGDQTVPGIARSKGVSRQHIQVNMDALLALKLVEGRDNPAHKRSSLYTLTTMGTDTFAEIRRREVAVLERLSANLDAETIEVGETALTALTQQISNEHWKGQNNE